ncbi:hypothetical protein ACQP25_22310 [Microtetraspora malaysiensis]|uniref:hypothetical protein n=1 Tax=Microtetraspora malaysiensis TaxID=161358 RepID=UPI003D8A45A2
MSVVAFPGPPTPPTDSAGSTAGSSITVAVEHFLESLQAATTRAGYAQTLARLTIVAGQSTRSPRSHPSSTPR